MRPIRLNQLFAWLVPTLAAGFLVPSTMVRQGLAQPDSPISLSVTLALVAIAGFGLTIPIASYRRKLVRFHSGELKKRPARPNPVFATRVLALAQAIAFAGAGFLGWHIGYLLWLFSDGILLGGLEAWTGLEASALALMAGWLGERNCRAPSDDAGGNGDAPTHETKGGEPA